MTHLIGDAIGQGSCVHGCRTAELGHICTTTAKVRPTEDGCGRGTPIVAFNAKAGGDPKTSPPYETGGITLTTNTEELAVSHVAHPIDTAATIKCANRLDAESAAGGHLVPFQRVTDQPDNRDIIVRRLTPLECERLQGFPDGWTATSHGKPQSDSQRYRQLGNSVAVPVFRWIAEGIALAEATS